MRTIKNTASMIAGGVEVSSDDKLILGISDGSSTASIWKLENGRKLQVFEGTGREGSFFYVEASPVDMHVVTNTLGHDLYLWDISTLQMVHAFDRRRKEGYRRMKISPNRQVVATYEYGFEVWDIQSKQLVKQFEWDSKSFEANDIAVSANGELAAISASKENGWAGIYDARSWEMISETPVRFDGDNLRLSPNGRFLLTEYNGFDLERGIRTHRESKFKPIGGEFLPDGKHIIFINDGMVGMWEFATGKLVKLFVLDEKSPGVKKMKLSPDGSRIATWNGNSDYDVWDVKSGKRLFSYRNHRIGEASDFAFLKSNKHIVKTSSKGEIKVWNFEKDKAVTLTCNGSDWLIYTDDGYFDASRRGGRQIALVDDLESYRIDQLAVRYNRPDIILSRMELGTPELIAHYKSLYEKRLRKLGLKEEQLKARFQKAPIAQILKAQKTGKHVDLSFEVSDNFSQLARVNVYVNDVPIFGSAGKAVTGRHQVLEQRIELLNGKNQIEVSALNTLGVESLRDSYLVQHSTSAKGDLYYLGFGVSRYQDHQLNLKYASKDVVDLEQVFSKAGKHFKNIHTRVLTDEQVTKAAIVKSRDFLSAATVQDTVVLFVAGHGLYAEGGSEYYYLTNEADLDNLEGSAVSFESIEGLLQTIAPRQKLLLLDTCQSGEMDSSYELAALNSANQQGLVSRGIQRVGASRSTNQSFLAVDRSRYIYNDLFRRTGAIVFSSSRGTELSYERDDIQNGLFTEELITALTTPVADSDRNRAISTEELRRHVSKAVTKKTGGLQNPTVDRDNIAALFSFPVVK
ncbi:MAG: hypothetical protein GY847_42235 [Proteobacteria bacterium]|nr:hypothetical protein [Pseudomonadota bacterium]